MDKALTREQIEELRPDDDAPMVADVRSDHMRALCDMALRSLQPDADEKINAAGQDSDTGRPAGNGHVSSAPVDPVTAAPTPSTVEKSGTVPVYEPLGYVYYFLHDPMGGQLFIIRHSNEQWNGQKPIAGQPTYTRLDEMPEEIRAMLAAAPKDKP